MGIGIIAMDHEGKILAAQSVTHKYIMDPATAEATAAWKAVELGYELGWRHIILEGDALAVINMLNSKDRWMKSYEVVVHETRNLLSRMLEWMVLHVSRTGNSTTHYAKNVFSLIIFLLVLTCL